MEKNHFDRVIKIGNIVVNMIIRSKVGGTQQDTCLDVASLLADLGLDKFEARKIDRGFSDISDKIAEACQKVMRTTELSEERQDVIIDNLIKAYEDLVPEYETFFRLIQDDSTLKKRLLEINKGCEKEFDTEECELYERLIEYTSQIIIKAVIRLPEFTSNGIKYLIGRLDDISEQFDDIIEQLNEIHLLIKDQDTSIRKFELEYRNRISNRCSYVNLFGAVGLEREYRKYPLSIAYVELEIVDDDSQERMKLNKILQPHSNIWITGDAGSGKTTFLQWLAVEIAGGRSDSEDMRGAIPILLELRKLDCKSISLKMCIEMVMKDSSYTIPAGWIEGLIESGKMVFLMDGFDEVSQTERNEVLSWMEELDQENRCTKIYTSRPNVKERPVFSGLLELRILPMNRERIGRFIEYWHYAVLEEQLKLDRQDALNISHKLYERVSLSDPLGKLASNPLLCAMICALHYRNDMNLPSDKRELYEECCKMLLDKRDAEKGVKGSLELTYGQKKIVLAQLAYWMIRNNHVTVDRKSAEDAIARSIENMNITDGSHCAQEIFEILLERSGILREPEKGKVDFIHKTFQEYLAACEISRQDDWGALRDKIGVDSWQEVIVVAIGFAPQRKASELIRHTLKLGQEEKEEKKYLFMGITYLNSAVEVEQELRNEIENSVSEMIPPALTECIKIAEAGNLAVPYLVNKKEYTEMDRLACLRTLRMIGTTKALLAVESYFDRYLNIDEIFEIGAFFGEVVMRELRENKVPVWIKNYILNYCGKRLIVHSSFLTVLNLLEDTDAKELEKNQIRELVILDYTDNISSINKCLFKKVRHLSISGIFQELDILKNFNRLKSLSLVCNDRSFSIYDLKQYKVLEHVEAFSIVMTKDEFINGVDLDFLKQCRCFELILMDEAGELFLEQFDRLKTVEELRIGYAYLDELDLKDLPNNIKKVVLYLLEGQEGWGEYVMDESVHHKKFKVEIKKYDSILKKLTICAERAEDQYFSGE